MSGARMPNAWWQSLYPPIPAVISWYLQRSEGWRVALGAAAVLGAIAGSISVVVFWSEILSLILIAIGLLAVALLLAAIGMLLGYLHKQNQRQIAAGDVVLARECREREAMLSDILEGRVRPCADTGRLLLRNAEVLWYMAQGVVRDEKGVRHVGDFCITSLRVVFVSSSAPLEISLEEINAVADTNGLQIFGRTARKSEGFELADPEVAAAHLRRAVRVYHRRVDQGFELGSRRIPQDVKTAVWQRDAGKCVECGSATYLEFDHVIPHARGGASTVQNVQLLCRSCNLKKGASI